MRSPNLALVMQRPLIILTGEIITIWLGMIQVSFRFHGTAGGEKGDDQGGLVKAIRSMSRALPGRGTLVPEKQDLIVDSEIEITTELTKLDGTTYCASSAR